MNRRFILTGVLFAALWATASAAGKYAIQFVEPLLVFQIRFLLAGTLLIFFSHIIKKERLPKPEEWKKIGLFGLLNTTLYLSLFILALSEISAGIGSLSTSTNSLIISILSSVWLGQQIKTRQWTAVLLGTIGVAIACYPLLVNNLATSKGLMLIFLSMLSYSAGTIYYSKIKWKISPITINGWQVFLGGIFMLPLTLYFHTPNSNIFTFKVWLSIIWLVIPVSIVAVQLWLHLLKKDTIRASFFLFLCPIFGFIYANVVLDEPITRYTWIGTALVLAGLYVGQGRQNTH